jgi:hypothetical protein
MYMRTLFFFSTHHGTIIVVGSYNAIALKNHYVALAPKRLRTRNQFLIFNPFSFRACNTTFAYKSPVMVVVVA